MKCLFQEVRDLYHTQKVLRKMTDGIHEKIVDGMTIILVANFFYLAFTA